MANVRVLDLEGWRREARCKLMAGFPPGQVNWLGADGGQATLDLGVDAASDTVASLRVPKAFSKLASTIAMHRDPERWNLLYEAVWRLTHGEKRLLEDRADPLMCRLGEMEKAIRRDIHKMRAFVRFRETAEKDFVAWYRPDHLIVEANAPFFVRRFGPMRWSILTPDKCAYWDGRELRFGEGLQRDHEPLEDQVEPLWLAYYASIFNPARLNISAMTAEMPVRHWATLPEAKLIQDLVRNSPDRIHAMMANQPKTARPHVPALTNIGDLNVALEECEGCELYQAATRSVAGQGPTTARIMLVGEQPGDEEDKSGLPFVGPAGVVLDRALKLAGIDRADVYVTNAVKHFHYEERGKRRIHSRPKGRHISACRPWLEAEIELVDPLAIVCLGATAAQSLLGRSVEVMKERGKWQYNRWGKSILVTLHPAALLRRVGGVLTDEDLLELVEDLIMARRALAGSAESPVL